MFSFWHRIKLLCCALFGHNVNGFDAITEKYAPNNTFQVSVQVEMTRQCDRCGLWEIDMSGYKKLNKLREEYPERD